jgi:hypothetical protein
MVTKRDTSRDTSKTQETQEKQEFHRRLQVSVLETKDWKVEISLRDETDELKRKIISTKSRRKAELLHNKIYDLVEK